MISIPSLDGELGDSNTYREGAEENDINHANFISVLYLNVSHSVWYIKTWNKKNTVSFK